MRAIVVRHYKTQGNLAREIMGWTESPPAHGWQADLLAVMQALRTADTSFDHIYTSDLQRALHTGQFYASTLAVNEIVPSAELREIDYGNMAKKSKDWVEKNIPRHKKDPHFVYPAGESFAQMQRRSVAYMQELSARHPQETVLVVAHAGVIRGLISYFLGLDYTANLKRKITHRYIGDFEFADGRCVAYNELGKPSGFVRDGVIKIPVDLQEAKSPRTA
jgi:broad specificity phosphatase PhoE